MKGKLNIDAVMTGAVHDGKRIFMRFVPVAFLLALLNVYVNYMMPGGIDPTDIDALFTQSLIGMLVSFVILLLQLLLAYGLVKNLPLAELPMEFLKRAPYFLIVAFLYLLLVMLGMVLLIVPGLILAITLSQSMVLVALTNSNPFNALGRSHNLVWGNAWRVLGAMLLLTLLLLILGALLFVIPGVDIEAFTALNSGDLGMDHPMFWAVVIFSTVIAPFYNCFSLNLYWELLKTESPEAPASPMASPDDFTA